MIREYEIKCYMDTFPKELSEFPVNTNDYGTFVNIPDEEFQHVMFLLKGRYNVWFSDYRYYMDDVDDECPVGISIMILPSED